MSEASAIEAAKKSLQLREILVNQLNVHVSDELSEARGETDAGIALRSGHIGYKLLNTEDNFNTVRFKYSCGVRLAPKDVIKNTRPNDLEKDDLLLEIVATYTVDYTMKEQLPEESLLEFGRINVGYHVWPFWRELLQSTCNRIGIAPISLPFYKPPKKADKQHQPST